MGKRKLHQQTYYQCDWTGLPMRQSNCYMPDWNEAGKLAKHGSYCCWEAVVAHAMESTRPEVSKEVRRLHRVREYINELVGCTVEPAPHWSKIAWFAQNTETDTITSPEDFLEKCKAPGPVVAVRMLADGTTHEVMCSKADIKNHFQDHLVRPFNLQGPCHEPQSFQTVRKKGVKDRDLTVFYWPFKNGLPFNQTATNIFKMQIYGDVLLIQQTKEPCFLPRERYVNYFHTSFQEQFANKSHKRKEPLPPSLTSEGYALVKDQMASELSQVETLASSSASAPGELAKAAVLPPPSGAELAELLRAKGLQPPKPKRQKAHHHQTPVVAVEA